MVEMFITDVILFIPDSRNCPVANTNHMKGMKVQSKMTSHKNYQGATLDFTLILNTMFNYKVLENIPQE